LHSIHVEEKTKSDKVKLLWFLHLILPITVLTCHFGGCMFHLKVIYP
jgi:hypothetical protein